MGMFDKKGTVRIKFCGNKGKNSGNHGWITKTLKPVNSKDEAIQVVVNTLKTGAVKDDEGVAISIKEGYKANPTGEYSYTKSQSTKDLYYHDFILINDETDDYCETGGGGRRRKTRKTRKTRRVKKSRKTRRNKK